MKLSICMMIKNEEKNLVRCLDKLKPLVDQGLAELIIVDTGSEDNSVNIAKQYTDRVYFHKWNKNFSEMRNISISYAKGEWLLLIDADERLDDLKELIKLLESNELDNYNTVFFKVKNLYNISDETNYALILSPRMFKNDGKFKYTGAVHNQPDFKGPVLSLEIYITHFGYIIGDKKLMKTKFERTSEILKSELKKSPENIYYIYQLGVTYDMHGDLKMALKNFKKAYDVLSQKGLAEQKSRVYVFAAYAGIAFRNGEIHECNKIAREGLELEKEYVDLYYDVAMCEKILKNEEESYKYFNKYINYAESYSDLKISTDVNLTMYYVNKKYKSIAYFELIKYYLKSEQYEKAYKIYNNVITTNEKIYSGINTLIPLKRYPELRKVYNKISSENDKVTFVWTLERKLKLLEEKEKVNVNKEFSSNEDAYGLLNKIRVSKIAEDKKGLTIELFNQFDFNKLPLFYSEIFEILKDDFELIINTFEKIEVSNLKNIVKYLIEEKKFAEPLEDYIYKCKNDNFNIERTKVLIAITDILLLIHIRDNDTIDKKYLELFKIYIEMGMNFVQKLYRLENSEEIYKNINNMEDRFFVIIYIVNKLIEEKNIKVAIRYMSEAVNTYPAFAKYIGIYKDEIFNLENEKNKEFDEYKITVKSSIKNLIDKNELEEAKKIISEYEKIVKDDVEIFSIKAVITIMENNLPEAEDILKRGLEIDETNGDLYYNLAYLYEQKGNLGLAIEQYKKAKNYCNDNNIREQINESIQQIVSNNPDLVNRNRQKIVFFVKQGMDSFLNEIIEEFSSEYETKKIIVNNYLQINEGMEWADICWFEWCDELIQYGSKLPIAKKRNIICRIHGYEVYTNQITQPDWKNVDDLIIVAPHIRRIFEENARDIIKENLRIHSIFCGVNLDKYSLDIKKKGFNLGYLGYLNFKKNIPLTLDIFKKLHDTDSRYKLYIAGEFQDSRTLAYFKYFIMENKLERNVLFDGWQNEKQKLKWFKKIDYMVISSIDEGLCFAAAESMASGIKPILHNCEGLKDHYDKKYIFNSVDDAVNMIKEDDYKSIEYRQFIEDNYSLQKEHFYLKKVLDNLK